MNKTSNNSSNTPTQSHLDIKGPKTNNTPNIKAPKGSTSLDQKTKDIFHIAKYFTENPHINLCHFLIETCKFTYGTEYTGVKLHKLLLEHIT